MPHEGCDGVLGVDGRLAELLAPEPPPAQPVEGPAWQYVLLHASVARLPGLAAVHALHAAGEACFEGPAPMDTRGVVLVVPDAATLDLVAAELTNAGVRYAMILEPDPPYNGSPTALGTMPVRDRTALQRILPKGRFPVCR